MCNHRGRWLWLLGDRFQRSHWPSLLELTTHSLILNMWITVQIPNLLFLFWSYYMEVNGILGYTVIGETRWRYNFILRGLLSNNYGPETQKIIHKNLRVRVVLSVEQSASVHARPATTLPTQTDRRISQNRIIETLDVKHQIKTVRACLFAEAVWR